MNYTSRQIRQTSRQARRGRLEDDRKESIRINRTPFLRKDEYMTTSMGSLSLNFCAVLLAVVLLHSSPVAAFGAGNIGKGSLHNP